MTRDPAHIDFHGAHEALVDAILANISFANAARLLLQRMVPPDDPMYHAIAAYSQIDESAGQSARRRSDYSWVAGD